MLERRSDRTSAGMLGRKGEAGGNGRVGVERTVTGQVSPTPQVLEPPSANLTGQVSAAPEVLEPPSANWGLLVVSAGGEPGVTVGSGAVEDVPVMERGLEPGG